MIYEYKIILVQSNPKKVNYFFFFVKMIIHNDIIYSKLHMRLRNNYFLIFLQTFSYFFRIIL